MQHIYSLRPGRPETAASIENPLPKVSLAKSRKFIKNNIGKSHGKLSRRHAIRKSAGGTLDPEMAKRLGKLIAMEKNTLRSLETVSQERSDGAEALSLWADEQEDDVSDVVDKVAVLMNEVGDLEDQYVDRYDQYRAALKQIRNIEKEVHNIRGRKEKLTNQIAKTKAKEDHDANELETLEHELVRLEAESLVAEKQLSTITHEKIKYGFRYQFAAMQELGEKMAIIAGYGNHLLDLIQDVPANPDEEAPKYDSYEASSAIVGECERALTTWAGSQASINADLPLRVRSMMSETAEPAKEGAVQSTKEDIAIPPKSKLRRRWSSDDENEPAKTEAVGQAVTA